MRFVKRHILGVYAALAIAYLMLPIAVVILFSFNSPAGRFNYVWNEFTLDNWVEWDAVLGLRESVIKSIQIGVLATVVAAALGTLIALAIVRHDFRGRGPTNVLVFLPMATPEIVLGASLLTVDDAKAIVDTWMATPMSEARYIRRLAKVRALERTS